MLFRSKQWFGEVVSAIENIEFSHDSVEKALRGLCEELGVQTGKLFYALRLALTGRTEAPGLFDIFVALGKDESISRLKRI